MISSMNNTFPLACLPVDETKMDQCLPELVPRMANLLSKTSHLLAATFDCH